MTAGAPKVFVDANILFSRTLRDWLVLLELHSRTSIYHLRWSEDVWVEMQYHLRRRNPTLPDSAVAGIRRESCGALPDAMVTGYTIDRSLDYVDQHDAHVHAAADHCGASYVVTNDSGYFRFASENDEILNYETYSADDFFILVDDNYPGVVRAVTEQQVAYWKDRQSNFNLVTMLEKASAPHFGGRILKHLADT